MSGRFTVAICTRNRPSLLRLCLKSLARAMDGRDHPVLVVDNGSTEGTTSVVASFADELRIRRTVEPTTGLSHARNRALAECDTEYIVYLDDDAKPDPGWIDAIEEGIEQWEPDFFGGPYRAFYLEEKPPWFRDDFDTLYTDREEREMEVGEHVSGGNMGWKTSLLRSLGGFPTSLGMKGNEIGVGEETYLINRMHHEYPERRGVFLPQMSMEHLVAEEKFNLWYWWKRAWRYGRDLPLIDPWEDRVGWWRVLRETSVFLRLGWRLLVRDREEYPYWRTYAMYCIGRSAVVFGAFFSPYRGEETPSRSSGDSRILSDSEGASEKQSAPLDEVSFTERR